MSLVWRHTELHFDSYIKQHQLNDVFRHAEILVSGHIISYQWFLLTR